MECDRLNSRRSLAAKGSGMAYDTSPFGVSGAAGNHGNNTPMTRIQRKAHPIDVSSVSSKHGMNYVADMLCQVESMAQTDSVVDIAKPTLVGDSAEDVRAGDLEMQDMT